MGAAWDISSLRQSAAKVTTQTLSEWRDVPLTALFKRFPWPRSQSPIGCWAMKTPGVISARGLWPWLHDKVKTGTGRLQALMGQVRPIFVFLNREVMSHTKVPSSQPAGMQLAGTKRSARVDFCLNVGLFQRGSCSRPAFHFICTSAFMSVSHSDISLCMYMCVFIFSSWIIWHISTLPPCTGRWGLWGVGVFSLGT